MKGVSEMSVTQNEKISQITESTMVVGMDIASDRHWARAFDWRGIELSKPFCFENDAEGFSYLMAWMRDVAAKANKAKVIIGAEPTGHYWFTLEQYLRQSNIKLVLVNPHHVKKSKEMDGNNPSKNDLKDPKLIARLVLEGRYMLPYIPEGIYAELRNAMNIRERIVQDMTRIKNQIQRWLKIYFPEYQNVFSGIYGVGSVVILREGLLPVDLIALGAEGVNAIWRRIKLRAVGIKRAQRLCAAAQISVGCRNGLAMARIEMQLLMQDYDTKLRQQEEVMNIVEALCEQLPETSELLNIKGIGLITVAGFFAETGDIRRFDSPRQVQKMAGLAITQNSSGKQKGQSQISKRGRSRLRRVLFQMAFSLLGKGGNEEFRKLHRYYTTREKNPLKKMQSIIAMSCKLIRIIYAVTTKGCAYDPVKMLTDIHRNAPQIAA
jgi:transposase